MKSQSMSPTQVGLTRRVPRTNRALIRALKNRKQMLKETLIIIIIFKSRIDEARALFKVA